MWGKGEGIVMQELEEAPLTLRGGPSFYWSVESTRAFPEILIDRMILRPIVPQLGNLPATKLFVWPGASLWTLGEQSHLVDIWELAKNSTRDLAAKRRLDNIGNPELCLLHFILSSARCHCSKRMQVPNLRRLCYLFLSRWRGQVIPWLSYESAVAFRFPIYNSLNTRKKKHWSLSFLMISDPARHYCRALLGGASQSNSLPQLLFLSFRSFRIVEKGWLSLDGRNKKETDLIKKTKAISYSFPCRSCAWWNSGLKSSLSHRPLPMLNVSQFTNEPVT